MLANCLAARIGSAKPQGRKSDDLRKIHLDFHFSAQSYNNGLAFNRRKRLADAHDGDFGLVGRADVNH